MSEIADEAWLVEQREVAVAFLEKQGIAKPELGEDPAFDVSPYVSLWAVRSKKNPDAVGWWVIAGDLPTDYVSASDAREPRGAIAAFARLLLAANLYAPASQETLVRDLMERFKMQRMLSPPDTSMLLVTVIGQGDPASFLRTWKSIVATDQIAAVWMSKLEKADFGIAPASGNITPQFQSLL